MPKSLSMSTIDVFQFRGCELAAASLSSWPITSTTGIAVGAVGADGGVACGAADVIFTSVGGGTLCGLAAAIDAFAVCWADLLNPSFSMIPLNMLMIGSLSLVVIQTPGVLPSNRSAGRRPSHEVSRSGFDDGRIRTLVEQRASVREGGA
jgi:hypothetical protein